MKVDNTLLSRLQLTGETGMGFYIFYTHQGPLAVNNDGSAIPFYNDIRYYCIENIVNGEPVPNIQGKPIPQNILNNNVYKSRVEAVSQLLVSSTFVNNIKYKMFLGTIGAFPLVAQQQLLVETIFFRCLTFFPNASNTYQDHRFVNGSLKGGTYLTSWIDIKHADTGFGAVGRYALPVPLPVNLVYGYKLPAGTMIDIGTVAPNFGQSGGGVEVRLVKNTNATQFKLPDLPQY